MKKFGCFLLAMILATGCLPAIDLPGFDDMAGLTDKWIFKCVGMTPLTTAETVTMKEIHLDNGSLLGREVIVRGNVVVRSKHATHIVWADETARLLIVLTDIESYDILDNDAPDVVSVLGTVESGKKGLSFIRATSLHKISRPSST